MALTTLDPETARIVIDMQKGVVQLPCAHRMAGVTRPVVDELGYNVALVTGAMTDSHRVARRLPPLKKESPCPGFTS